MIASSIIDVLAIKHNINKTIDTYNQSIEDFYEIYESITSFI